MKSVILFFVLILNTIGFLQGQESVSFSKASILHNIVEQIVLFPQEKLYLQIDKTIYVSGEKIWYKAYLVDATLHQSIINQDVIVELINPLDSVVCRAKVKQYSKFSGYFKLPEGLPEGDYTICSYTENMLNTGRDFFFRKKIYIIDPLTASMQVEVKFTSGAKEKIVSEISILDLNSRKKIKPDKINVRVNNQSNVHLVPDKDSITNFTFNLPENSKHRIFYIETKKYRKYLPIPFLVDDFEVTFYPEGGYLLQGTTCVVAFKVLKSNGLPKMTTGQIVDNEDKLISQITTTHEGMGIFSLLPEAGKSYYAVFKNEDGTEKRFKLPDAGEGKYSLKAEKEKNMLYVSVLRSSHLKGPDSLYLLLQTRGMVHYAAAWDSNFESISFDLNKFPSGVMQIMLFDNHMNPLSERLFFCRNDDQAKVSFQPDNQNYEQRQLVNARVKVTDRNGAPQGGTFSVSVTDDQDVLPDRTTSILTNLLLTSELKGYIDNPAWYFQNDNPLAETALDMLMLTQGWRRYNIPEIVKGEYMKPGIPPKNNIKISGTVKSFRRGKPVEQGKVMIISWGAGYFNEVETDNFGHFVFEGFDCIDSTTFVVQALTKLGSENLEIFIDPEKYPQAAGLPSVYPSLNTDNGDQLHKVELLSYAKKADQKYTIENGMRMIYMDEVKITAKAREKKEQNYSFYMPDSKRNVLTAAQLEMYQPADVAHALIYLDFVRTEEIDGKTKALLNRVSTRMVGDRYNIAALIIDDLAIPDYDLNNEVDISNIEKIGILKGTEASKLGGDGAGGAIVITTKRGKAVIDDSQKYNIKTVTPLGLQTPVAFYSPKYETLEERNNSQPDLRTTIYWNPNVKISSLGEAAINFYTSDASTTYSVVIEGITSDGKIIQSIGKISGKE